MLSILLSVLVGFLLHLCKFDSLIGLSDSTYYLSFAVFGALCHFIRKIKE